MGKLEDIADQALAYRAIQYRPELIWLFEKIELMDKRSVAVELGTYKGGMFYAFSQFFDRVIAVDFAEKAFPFSLRPEDKYIIGNTQDDSIVASVEDTIDFLFIDANHSYGGVSKDYELWFPKVRKGGIVGFHDISGEDGVIQFFGELKKDYKSDQIKTDDKLCGIGIIYK